MGEFSEYFEDFPEENPANWAASPVDPLEELRTRIAQPESPFPGKVLSTIREIQAQGGLKESAPYKET